MRSRDFAFWLQGFFELREMGKDLSEQQVETIRQHLSLVFQHDPEIAAKPHPAPSPPGMTVAGGPLSGIMIC
jgi:hypothetical protein